MSDARIDEFTRQRDTDVSTRSRIAIQWMAIKRQLQTDWAIFKRNRLAVLGLIMIGIFALMAVSHPLLMEFVWDEGRYNTDTGYDVTIQPWPSPPRFPDHLLGVDAFGRDILSLLLAATRPSFTVAISAAMMTAVVSTLIAAVSAYYRGRLDAVFSNVADVLLMFPVPIVMLLLISRWFYDDVGSLSFGLMYGVLAGASSAAIVMRSYALKLMARPFIEAARVAGGGATHIIFRHLIPHMLPLVSVHMMIAVTGAVVTEGFIIFTGLRSDIRTNWGAMVFMAIEWAVSVSQQVAWAAVIAPTLALSLFAASFYFVSRGLQDVADPSMRDSRG